MNFKHRYVWSELTGLQRYTLIQRLVDGAFCIRIGEPESEIDDHVPFRIDGINGWIVLIPEYSGPLVEAPDGRKVPPLYLHDKPRFIEEMKPIVLPQDTPVYTDDPL